jgi:hypothetical protein
MHLTLAVANQAAAENLEADLEVERDLAVAAENLEADLDLVAAAGNPQVLIKEMEKVIVLDRALDRALDRDLDHHPQAESL